MTTSNANFLTVKFLIIKYYYSNFFIYIFIIKFDIILLGGMIYMWFLSIGAVIGMLAGGVLYYDNDNKDTKKLGETLFFIGLVCFIVYICIMAGNK